MHGRHKHDMNTVMTGWLLAVQGAEVLGNTCDESAGKIQKHTAAATVSGPTSCSNPGAGRLQRMAGQNAVPASQRGSYLDTKLLEALSGSAPADVPQGAAFFHYLLLHHIALAGEVHVQEHAPLPSAITDTART